MKRVYDTLLSKPFDAIDLMYYKYIQSNLPCYIVYPPPILQESQFTSDVTFHGKQNNKVKWTNKYMDIFKKYWRS